MHSTTVLLAPTVYTANSVTLHMNNNASCVNLCFVTHVLYFCAFNVFTVVDPEFLGDGGKL